MTRRDQMLHDFDSLATAELEDIANTRRHGPARPVATRPVVQARAPRSSTSVWDWAIGACVLGLVLLAARS